MFERKQSNGDTVMIKMIAGIVLGLLIGAGCRWFDVPAPAPPKLIGAILVVAMTVGYLGADRLMSQHSATAVRVANGPSSDSAPPGN
jgi:XapX domain-containing protein